MCVIGGTGSGVAVNGGGANVTSAGTTSVIPAPVAVTTFPAQHQQQPTLIDPSLLQHYSGNRKGAITSKIKHAIKHKTSPARLAQLDGTPSSAAR